MSAAPCPTRQPDTAMRQRSASPWPWTALEGRRDQLKPRLDVRRWGYGIGPASSSASGLPRLWVMAETDVIRTPDQRVRVFVSSTLRELAAERQAVRDAVMRLRLVPVMFELGARPHPPQRVYRAYLAQSQVFVGVYWQSYGWVPPEHEVSGLEDEYLLAADLPRLIYVKEPAPDRAERLAGMLARIRDDAEVSYQHFSESAELGQLVENDLALLLSERFDLTKAHERDAGEARRAGSLPVPATPLVGREPDAAAVSEMVLAEGARLVTLTGPGGVGKSRLAVEAARRLGPTFADGVRFVELASVRAAELAAPGIAAGLGLRTSGGRSVDDLKSYLRSRRLLLVLDNFEQLLGTAWLVADLLADAPGLVVLVTSRTVLRLSGEHEYPVPTLSVPPRASRDAADTLQYASVRLFADRAHAKTPAFQLTDANARDVAEVCRRLDGLPLAIELAAARIRLLPPQALLARLGHRQEVLTGGARDLPARQQTLKATLDWSFGLLTGAEQAVFARLGVFAGTFSLPAAEAVCGKNCVPGSDDAGESADVMDTLSSLVDNSLVRPEKGTGEPRFMLLDTIREYALDRLRSGAGWQDAHDLHAAYFMALAEPAEAELHDPGQLGWLDRLETEHDNLQSAMSWLIDQDHLQQALHMGWATWRYWWLHGHAEELAPFVDQIPARSERLPPHVRAQAWFAAGFEHLARGDEATGQHHMEQSLPLFRQTGDKLNAARALNALGHLSALQGQPAAASQRLEESLALLREADSDQLAADERARYGLAVAEARTFLGQVRLLEGDHDRAARLLTDSLAGARRIRDRFAILISLYDLALAKQAQGDLTGADSYLKEGLSLAAEAGDQTTVAYYLEGMAAARLRASPERAVRLLAAARTMLEERGSGWLHAWVPRAPHDDSVLAVLRSRMGVAAFEEARRWGESRPGRHVVQYALEKQMT